MSDRRRGEGALEAGLRFRDSEAARLWLLERLDRLEETVSDSGDLQRVAATLTGEALTQLESDPLSFRRTAVIHLRDLLSQVTEGAAARTEREGFNVPALERLALATIGESPTHGREVLAGLADGLRERIKVLSSQGSEAHETAQARLDEALLALDQSLDRVVQRWESASLGIWSRWARRRRLRKQGLDRVAALPELQLGLAEAAREQRPAFEQAWESSTRAASVLGVARSYSDVLEWLAGVLGGLDQQARDSEIIAREAGHRLQRLEGTWRRAGSRDDVNLLTPELLDQVLDHLGLDARAFFGRSEVRAAELGSTSRSALANSYSRWAETELSRLPDESLLQVLGGFAGAPSVSAPLVGLLKSGQPLLRFNDDLHRLWPEGLPAQYYVLAEATDETIHGPLGDACVQVGLPAPLYEVGGEGDGVVQVRVLQLVAGLAWLSEAERLLPMVEVHAQVMAEADAHLQTKEGLRAALRDAVESESLGSMLPDEVLGALRELRGLKAQVVEAREGAEAPSAEAKPPGKPKAESRKDEQAKAGADEATAQAADKQRKKKGTRKSTRAKKRKTEKKAEADSGDKDAEADGQARHAAGALAADDGGAEHEEARTWGATPSS